MSGPDPKNPESVAHDLWGPCSPGDPKGTEKSWMDIPGDKLREPEVDFNMILRSLTSQKKTVNDEDLTKLSKFAADFGQDG
jgi:vacuolar protein-sorting-associated protein 4